jgi:hypothetical protein
MASKFVGSGGWKNMSVFSGNLAVFVRFLHSHVQANIEQYTYPASPEEVRQH